MKPMRPALGAAIEIASLLTIIAVTALLAVLGLVTLHACVWITVLFMLGLLLLAWKRFEGGRHPCFLFLGMLFIFQCGLPLGYVMGMIDNPMQIVVATFTPITVPIAAAEITLLLIALSAVLIYAPCRLQPGSPGFWAGDARRWLPGVYALLILTLPFALYKNVMYLSYIRAHGGYLAVYTDNAAVLASAGFIARTLSTINDTAILTAYILESRPGRRRMVLTLFFLLASLDLLIGFRGKFFAEAISLWFIHNLRTGRRFRLGQIAMVGALASMAALMVAGFRENRVTSLVSPLGVVVAQGVSMNVTEAAVVFHREFARFGWSYLWNGFLNGITPVAQGPGKLWTWDLTVALNRAAFERGFGTASAYLAELYLFAGLPAVMLGSLGIGYGLRWLQRASARLSGALVMVFILPSVIYLPRLELLAPFGALLKAAVGLVIVAAFVVFYQAACHLVRLALTRRGGHDALSGGSGDSPAPAR